jgi:hypothetical protein
MLVIAPKDNLAATFPSRVAVVIEPSCGGPAVDLISVDDLAGSVQDIASSKADQGD